jgi:hypothetical protein
VLTAALLDGSDDGAAAEDEPDSGAALVAGPLAAAELDDGAGEPDADTELGVTELGEL